MRKVRNCNEHLFTSYSIQSLNYSMLSGKIKWNGFSNSFQVKNCRSLIILKKRENC